MTLYNNDKIEKKYTLTFISKNEYIAIDHKLFKALQYIVWTRKYYTEKFNKVIYSISFVYGSVRAYVEYRGIQFRVNTNSVANR